ncbi:pulmonary surfactant-associated protein A-like [Haliotis asinina]|uniref:pulmonary surfactant-associated protein A-like n=1 Tax=Haliotis asinina TaxID=109174 RepID=UPI003531AC6D
MLNVHTGKRRGYSRIQYDNKVVFTSLKTRHSTWKAALKLCQGDGGVLVQLKTKAYEKLILKKYSKFELAAWIGMVDDPDVNNFHWVDGDYPSHDNWGPREPSHSFRSKKENCVILRAGKWFDTNCEEKYQSICEICGAP